MLVKKLAFLLFAVTLFGFVACSDNSSSAEIELPDSTKTMDDLLNNFGTACTKSKKCERVRIEEWDGDFAECDGAGTWTRVAEDKRSSACSSN
ncbi:hypothetical protein [Fibrobacter sp. UWP2]|uniref:hypothetical protein n=1 Tax=Fibrobacter sp. UWP2 TaxID=1896216 RepID=UPI000915575D|nr:hypothetical protein [Fibrobacter sp. UWP2]SHI33864.1 hypothetical protein SAMN05720471_101216 [Fibrobacter sp. UWP2]